MGNMRKAHMRQRRIRTDRDLANELVRHGIEIDRPSLGGGFVVNAPVTSVRFLDLGGDRINRAPVGWSQCLVTLRDDGSFDVDLRET